MDKKLPRIYLLATLTVALFSTQGLVGQSLSFDGDGEAGMVDGDYVSVANDASLNFSTIEGRTLSAWFKVDEIPTSTWGSWVFKKSYGYNTGVYGIKIQNNGRMNVYVTQYSNIMGPTIVLGQWYHVLVKHSATNT